MKRSELVDCGYDYDYAETIRMGDAYEWDYSDEDDEGYYDCDRDDLEMGFDPYEGGYTYDC